MTPREFERLRKEAGFSLRKLSAVMAVQKSTIVRWQSGRARIPEARASQVRLLHAEALKTQQKGGDMKKADKGRKTVDSQKPHAKRKAAERKERRML